MQELGVGMIGYGFMGKVHTLAYRSIPIMYDPQPLKVRLVGVATAHEETAAKAVEAGYEFGTDDWREVVHNDDVHIIHCCTPNKYHKELLLEAIKAGKHIYCDKPLALNLCDAEEILAASRKGKGKYQLTFHNRFFPATLRAKQLIEEGFIGNVFHFRANYFHSGYIDPERPMSWRLNKDIAGGGAVVDLGSHIIDLMRHLLGDYESVYAHTETFIKERPSAEGRQKVEVDDFATMQVRLKSGAVGTIETSRFATGSQGDMRFEIYGSKGALRYNMMDGNFLYAYDAGDPGGPIGGLRGYKQIECVQRYPEPSSVPSGNSPVGWTRAHIHSLHEFLSHIADDGATSPDFEDGLAVQKVMDCIYKSAESNTWVEI